jgi:hypothetical protein
MEQQETSSRAQETAPPSSAPHGLPNEAYYRAPLAQPARNNRSLGAALVIVGLIWLMTSWLPGLPGIGIFGSHDVAVVDQTVQANRLVLDAGSADVELKGSDSEGIRVRALGSNGAADDFSVVLDTARDGLHISHTVKPWLLGNRHLTYQIELPPATQVVIQTTSGEVVAEGVAGGVDIKTTSGDVELSEISGPVTVGTVSGDIRLSDGQVADAHINTTSGEIELEGVGEALVVQSVSGDIQIRDAQDGQITLSTTSGEVSYEGSVAPGSENSVSSISGDVILRLPEATGLQLDASSVSGDLSTDFSITGTQEARALRGTSGDGGSSLKITTTSGDISIEQE